MPVDGAILAAMPHLFVWKKKTGQDAWQSPTLTVQGDPIQGIYHSGSHQVTDDNGVKRTAEGAAYLSDVYPIETVDELWFCDAALGEIIKVESWPDPRTGGPYGMVVHHG